MSKIPYRLVDTWQEACDICPNQPVILVWFYNTTLDHYMRYHGEFHKIDAVSYVEVGGRWSIAGIWFTPYSIAWMLDNSIALPFTREDYMLYYMTWGDCRE